MREPTIPPNQPIAAVRASAAGSGVGWRTVVVALFLLTLGAVLATGEGGGQLGLLWLIGAGLGIALYHSAFGFAAGFRSVLGEARSVGLRAQLLLLGLSLLLFYPALEAGQAFGLPVRGFVFPLGLELLVGAFLFGIGMQWAGGCASGTLYATGGGSPRMLLTLLCFVGGATLAAFAHPLWADLPRLPAVSLPASFGLWPALAVQLGLLAALWLWLAGRERRAHGTVGSLWRNPQASLWRGRWPLGMGAVVLAVLSFATLLVAGRPWGITQAFALWGAWGVEASGLDDPAFWPYWEVATRAELLHRPLFADTTSVMDLGLAVGALLAAGLAGRFRPDWRLSPDALAGAVLGGLLLGFGAVLATGCNIGAYLSGVASGSLHGWLWLAAALPGNAVGLYLRAWPRPAERRAGAAPGWLGAGGTA
ncbi:MAG: YeeE/YedE family protein [Alphaproteobacteria bacterium]|nr:YeeE/YedE family protein [Alphaproteobacteria bacterium]